LRGWMVLSCPEAQPTLSRANTAPWNHGKSAPADLPREQTDRAILSHALESRKPVLPSATGCTSVLILCCLAGTLISGPAQPRARATSIPDIRNTKDVVSRVWAWNRSMRQHNESPPYARTIVRLGQVDGGRRPGQLDDHSLDYETLCCHIGATVIARP